MLKTMLKEGKTSLMSVENSVEKLNTSGFLLC